MIEERGEQIQRVLTALAKHADVVAEAFDGAVESGDKARNSAIDALYAVGALKPYDEGSYLLIHFQSWPSGDAAKNLDYLEVVHVFLRRPNSSRQALHQAWQAP